VGVWFRLRYPEDKRRPPLAKPPSSTADVIRDIRARTVVTETGCYEWTGATNSDGRAKKTINRKSTKLSRWIMVMQGELDSLDSPLWVLHHCDNPRCIRPSHMYVGTATDNNHDIVTRGRHGTAKLKPEQVLEIRKLASQKVSQYKIAKQFNITQANVSGIHLRKNWKWL